MSRKGVLIVAAVFGVAFLLLALATRGYREVEALQSIGKAMAAVRRDFPGAVPVSTDGLAAMLASPDPPLLVDVRSADEFAASRIPGAIPLADFKEAELSKGTRTLVFYDSVGFRSAGRVERWGTGEARYLEGGIFQWAAAGRPLVDADGKPTRKVHPYNRYWGRLLPFDAKVE